MAAGDTEVSRLMRAVGSGVEGAEDRLFAVIYSELRALAHARLRGERPGATLQTTALVNETYVRLVGDRAGVFRNRAYFFAAAAEAMRRILVDRARRAGAARHGGGLRRVPIDEGVAAPVTEPDLIALDAALSALEGQDARKASVVKLRYFAGMSVSEVASVLDISPRTVDNDWQLAKAWLKRALESDADADP